MNLLLNHIVDKFIAHNVQYDYLMRTLYLNIEFDKILCHEIVLQVHVRFHYESYHFIVTLILYEVQVIFYNLLRNSSNSHFGTF